MSSTPGAAAAAAERAGPRVRDSSIDVLKGIGIVIIAMGHIDSTGIGGAFITYLYTFNVALFFVIAGYMWRAKPGESFLSVIGTKFRQVYVPYLVLFLISLLYGHLVVRFVFDQYVIPFEWGATIKALLFSSEWLNSVPTFNFALWFLPIFFIASVTFQLLQLITNPKAYLIVVGALIAISLPVQLLLPGRPILTINVLPVALALMACGYLLKRYRVVEGLPVFALCAGALLSLAVAFFAPGNIGGIATYWFFPSAIASFILLLRLARAVRENRFLAYVGRNSLLVFGLHTLIANTYSFTRIPNLLDNAWDGMMLYLANLGYVVVVSVLVVAAYRGCRRLVDTGLDPRRQRRRQRRTRPETTPITGQQVTE
jgi:fucose 4-O-acetylase-like acetyltransferase